VEVVVGVVVPFIGPERQGGDWSEGKRPAGGGVLLCWFLKPKRGEGRQGGVVMVGEMKKAGHQFGSTTHTWRRAADGGGGSAESEEEEGPGGPVMDREAKMCWASAEIFQGEWSRLQI
jgi:hypothetical protein